MPNIYIQLGFLGDVLNILPLAYADAKNGQRASIMTCKEFAPVLEGCSYVDPIPFDGNPFELDRAVEQAKSLNGKVTVTQVIGETDAIKRLAYEPAGLDRSVTDSFSKESWKLAGRLKDFAKHPLIFDRRSPERELAVIMDYVNNKLKQVNLSRQRKYILVA